MHPFSRRNAYVIPVVRTEKGNAIEVSELVNGCSKETGSHTGDKLGKP